MACEKCSGSSETLLLQSILTQQQENNKLLTDMNGTVEATKTDVANLRGELFGSSGKITQMEKKFETQDTREWIKTAVVAPITGAIMLGLHAGLRKLGIDV